MSAPYILAFMDEMNGRGLAWKDGRYREPIDDGRLHRYDIEGDKPRSRNGWYVLYGGRFSAGCFGSWKLGERYNWCAVKEDSLTEAEREAIKRQQEEARRQYAAERLGVHKQAAEECARLWETARSLVAVDHPYLVKKQVAAYGIRQLRKALLIPVRALSGQLTSLQFIYPNGVKQFKSGGQIKGCFHRFGKPKDTTIYICEGYATGATIHEQTGHAVAIAFNASNLVVVALLLRKNTRHTIFILLLIMIGLQRETLG